MSKPRIATVPVAVALAVAATLPAASAAHATAPGHVSAKPQPGGHSAFTPDAFTTDPSPATRSKAVSDARKALAAHEGAAHIKPGDVLTPRTVVVAKDGTADVRFDRTFKGLPVYGGDLIVHLKPGGSYKTLNTATPAAAVSTTPTVAAASAARTSRARLHGTVSSVGSPHLAVWATRSSSQLVWETVVRGVRADQAPSVLHVLVDARKGTVVTERDEIQTLLSSAQQKAAAKAGASPQIAGTGNSIYSGSVSIDLTQSGSTWSMKDPSHGNGFTTDLNHATSGTGTIFSNTTGTFGNGTNSDPASAGVDAHYGAADTYDYYKNVHGRSGIFGNGAGVPSRTHYGNAYVNAFWDGTQMTYGDGAGNARPLVELDVAGHEMSHGVSGALTGWGENGETGGMNEGTSDIFGTMVEFYANNAKDTPDYTIGELININGDNKPLRYMYQPSLDGASPDCYTSSNGSLDPHYSLGPLSHWFFLLAVGSGDHGYGNSPTCNSSTVTGIGNDKAGKIWYKALASYANSNDTYANARTDSLKAAADLYGTHCTEYNTVNAAWAAVSVTGADPVPGKCPPPPGHLAYTGPTTADYHDSFTASAKLTVAGAPVTGATVDFSLGHGDAGETCSAATDGSGTAACALTPDEAAGSTTLTASFAGNDSAGPASVSVPFTITKEETTLTYTGPTHIANATPVHLNGVLKEDGTAPIAGRTVTFRIGAGSSQQTCTGTTNASGTADCVITPDQPLNDAGTVPLTADFAGDAFYQPSSASATLLLQFMTGRAYGLTATVQLPLLSVTQPPTPDTGPVRTAGATTTSTPCSVKLTLIILSADGLCPKVTTTVNPGTSTATTTVDDVSIGIPGVPAIKVTNIKATSTSRCTAASGSVTAATLSIGGVPVTIPTAPNSKIDLPGVGRLTVNEQIPLNGADAGLTVNGLHLTALGNAVDVVIASATSDAHNCG
ncbi:choice-of-anchor P family protein [Actinoallomurus sp. CA-150999]|uniref:choice-of-anchor P family protein n=1 Tax=Actinoallomurus sp. CA-150999 TaxID=3239887 RepID=UPI003D90BF96